MTYVVLKKNFYYIAQCDDICKILHKKLTENIHIRITKPIFAFDIDGRTNREIKKLAKTFYNRKIITINHLTFADDLKKKRIRNLM